MSRSLVSLVTRSGSSGRRIRVPRQFVNAFVELQQLGYFAKANFWCCSTCALYDIPRDTKKFVFYHDQDAENLRDNGQTYLGWAGDGQEICSILNKHGITTQWSGSTDTRILAKI